MEKDALISWEPSRSPGPHSGVWNITPKKSGILQTDDTGRDTKSAQSHLRKHEGFENDLVALEAQLQVLIDDSAALQARYPGENGQHIAQQQKIVLQAWNELQEKEADMNAALMSSNGYHTFMGMVRDLLAWPSGLRRGRTPEEKEIPKCSLETIYNRLQLTEVQRMSRA